MTPRRAHNAAPSRQRGFSLVEVVVAILVLSALLAASLNTVAASASMQRHAADRARARVLALDLLNEARRHPYDDPIAGSGTGPGPGEINGTRSLFNDVDDFNGWSASPPQRTDGSVIPGFEGWTRACTVEYVSLANPATTVLTDSGVKRITVTVFRGKQPMATAVGLRTRALDEFLD
ncbi:MAG TPA: prepilin-type N-terminal cleavage/methylation domain-containing protein [Phycisphaerales bacterium]|nr:prepilin-type N-terminal cleavage/methylation domain-containing protein [Phycisphaerales bacterium]